MCAAGAMTSARKMPDRSINDRSRSKYRGEGWISPRSVRPPPSNRAILLVIVPVSANASKGTTIAMTDQFPVFEVVLKKRGRTTWRWRVCTPTGDVVMHGSEASQPAARYKADRALFLLLL